MGELHRSDGRQRDMDESLYRLGAIDTGGIIEVGIDILESG